ncbi:hypothetical protein C8R44DRAFT_955647 [Mycena epipterygia]|nr:hypothetical protein C8R44DRAFT_955647 [Mycena epipterygia]
MRLDPKQHDHSWPYGLQNFGTLRKRVDNPAECPVEIKSENGEARTPDVRTCTVIWEAKIWSLHPALSLTDLRRVSSRSNNRPDISVFVDRTIFAGCVRFCPTSAVPHQEWKPILWVSTPDEAQQDHQHTWFHFISTSCVQHSSSTFFFILTTRPINNPIKPALQALIFMSSQEALLTLTEIYLQVALLERDTLIQSIVGGGPGYRVARKYLPRRLHFLATPHIWRCWAVWNRNFKIIILPTLCALGGGVLGFVSIATEIQVIQNPGFDRNTNIVLASAYFIMSLVTTLSATLLIICRIVRLSHGHTTYYAHVLETLIESAALYCIVLLVLLPFYFRNSPSNAYPEAMLVQIELFPLRILCSAPLVFLSIIL